MATAAEIDNFILFSLVLYRPENRTFMFSIAKRLRFRFSAGTIPITFSCVDRHSVSSVMILISVIVEERLPNSARLR